MIYLRSRKQTLAFKGFLVSACTWFTIKLKFRIPTHTHGSPSILSVLTVTMFGLVVGADNALLSHEKHQRRVESALRREARIDLAKRGLVGTETEIAKWKEERARAMDQQQAQRGQQEAQDASTQQTS